MQKSIHEPTGTRSGSLRTECAVVVDALASSAALSEYSLLRVVDLVERFCSFCEQALDVSSLAEVSAAEAAAFVRAPNADGPPAVATMHLRRSTLRLLFRTVRQLGLANSDPTLDLVLPPRSSLTARPLTDEEVALCRSASMHTLTATRLPAAWGLAEVSARSSELGHIQIRDIDIDDGRVRLHGSSRFEARWVQLSGWGHSQLTRRLKVLPDDPDWPVIYEGTRGSDYHRQAAACVAIGETLRRAGVAGEPDVRPASVAAWAGRRILTETGRIDDVARRLGIRSLDRTAALIAWDWQTDLKGGE